MQGINRSGFSPVIQMTILSTLSIISLLLIWGYVVDLSTGLDEQLSPVVDCINQQSEVTSACINTDGKIELTVNTALEEKINKLNINIGQESFSCDKLCQSCTILQKEGSQTIYLGAESPSPANLVASINGCTPQQFEIKKCVL